MTAHREPGRLAVVPPDPKRRAVVAPGAVECRHLQAESDALSGLTDDERASLGLPTTGHGMRPGPAQGYPLRESRAAVRRRRQWLCAALALFMVALVLGLAP